MATSVRLTQEIEQRLKSLSKRTGLSKSFLLRELIESNLEDCEDFYLSQDVLERIRKGAEQKRCVDVVRRELK